MEVQIPSPSVFLRDSPVITPAPVVQPKKAAITKPKPHPPPKPLNKSVQDGAVTKPKQSKSRNGYKKDYKWRTFEETTFASRPTVKRKAFRSNSLSPTHNVANPLGIAGGARPEVRQHRIEAIGSAQTWSPGLHSAFETAVHAFQGNGDDHPQPQGSVSSPERQVDMQVDGDLSPPLNLTTPDSIFMPAFETDGMSPGLTLGDSVDPYSLTTTTTSSSIDSNSAESFSSGSPQLLDIMISAESNLNALPDPCELEPPMPLHDGIPTEDDFDEEIIRSDAIATSAAMTAMQLPTPSSMLDPSFSNTAFQAFRASSPTPSESSTASSKSSDMTILAQPSLDASSPEMLMLRFDKQTCGILSVKDGPTENPWRTLIWPLARESPALYHAISSMTAFHGAHEIPHLHVPGMAHMTKAIKRLAFEIENMRLDSALATSLALAFSEGWDRHVSTGVQHLRGAKVMVNNAIIKHQRDMQLGQMTTQDANRLKFLCNTFVYMDVIARLTSLEEAPELNFEEILATVNAPFGDQVEVDPLMGCAATLFPLMGRVANLIQRVRKTESNSLTIVSTAMELKEQLQQWQVPSALIFERPEDPNSEVQHSIQTAEAYRYATLLYLHQAVPEIPSDPAASLAKKVLVTLASVPLSSRATIVQIFPLFAASCEVTDSDDRTWVVQRWQAMIRRLKIGNVNSCWNVVQEVWARRDAYEDEKSNRLLRQYASRGVPGGNFVPPVLDVPPALKRKAYTADSLGMGDPGHFSHGQHGPQDRQGGGPGHLDATGRPVKRRLTMDSLGSGSAMSAMSMTMPPPPVSLPRRHTSDIMSSDQLEPEYTVRGQLHWLGVMTDWQWEGMFEFPQTFCFWNCFVSSWSHTLMLAALFFRTFSPRAAS
ncbi:hypothetical protein AYO20_02893 [Fonsecaea nubica]|uniref:Uncharacterized protein n=1 Tax=Fonsecaea nubica TaxID=856822 RepID=A0A178D7J0_9EURO|nr:hypothetical protein AYO20_02893 [Fonsecaea nubica]OAL37716.1 hypothetical protein AYO20_02893 [Fonsecaea nubica]